MLVPNIQKVKCYASPYMRDEDKRTGWEKFKTVLWEPEHKKFLRRTWQSWAKILTFFTIFYSCVIGMLLLSMHIFFSCISEVHPVYTQNESRIGSNPGIALRPLSFDAAIITETAKGALISYATYDNDTAIKWVDLTNDFLQQYYTSNMTNTEECNYNKLPSSGKVCGVDVSDWHPCTANDSFSFFSTSPCFFIKVNRIYGWIPQVYNDTLDLPKTMPQDLQDHISSLPPEERNQIWVSCAGEKPADKELYPSERVEYFPRRGFPVYYYPYVNTPGYLSPLVAIRLKNFPMHRNIKVECRVWAKNIKYVGSMRDRQGSVQFEVRID